MRCDEVMREFTLPSDVRDGRAIAEHLAECAACRTWSEHSVMFDRLWNTTRPVDPSAEAWDGIWSSVIARLDGAGQRTSADCRPERSLALVAPTTSHRSQFARFGRGIAVIGLVGLAQAAAVLLAVTMFWKPGTSDVRPGSGFSRNPDMAQQIAPSLNSVVDVEWGQVVLIRSKGPDQVETTDLALLEPSSGEDPWYDFYNSVESASAVVAMTE